MKIKSGIFLALTELLSDLLSENEEKEIETFCINYFGNNFLSSRKFEFWYNYIKISVRIVRSHGSGNAGSTNMLRNYGKKHAVMI
ncbi:MAG: glycerol-3-phosphate acyltransferase [Eubacterium sp.]